MYTCSTRIHINGGDLRVFHDFAYVGMTAYEYIWLVYVQLLPYPMVIAPWSTSDMRNPDFHPFNSETLVQREFCPDLGSIYIPIHSSQRCNLPQSIRDKEVTDISGMPDLIHAL